MRIKQMYNIFGSMYSYFHKEVISRGHPTLFAIELTNDCMMDCKMCPRRNMGRPEGYISFELFKKIIDDSRGLTPWVWLHQFGDPLLHPDIEIFTKYARSKGIKTRLSTNPQTLTPKVVERLMKSDLDFLHIALDGIDFKTYRSIRGSTADYDLAIKSINHLLDEKIKNKKKMKVRMGIIRMNGTIDQVDEFRTMWTRKGVDEIEVKNLLTWDGTDKVIMKLAKKAYVNKRFFNRKKTVCFKPWLHFVIQWDGTVVPCCFDYDARNIVGDVNKQSLKEIWNNKKMQDFRNANLKNEFPDGHLCKGCKEKLGVTIETIDKLYPFNPFMLKKYWGRFVNVFKRKAFLG